MTAVIRIWVPGTPATQGSAKAFINRGRPVITHDNRKTIPWRNTIAHCAMQEMHGRYAGHRVPVHVDIAFTFPRPASHLLVSGVPRKSAPAYPRLDLDKLVRAVFDGLTGVAWHDDSQVADLTAGKDYVTDPAGQPGALILLSADWQQAAGEGAA